MDRDIQNLNNFGEVKILSLREVFDQIVNIMHDDYAGCFDKTGWDRPQYFRERLAALDYSNQLTREVFEEIVREYLLDFKDDHNVLKSIEPNAPNMTVGFKVRRYENRLYIEKVDQEDRVEKGAALLSLDHNPIQVIASNYRHLLNSDITDREDWSWVLLKAITCDVVFPDGRIETIKLKHYPEIMPVSHYTFQQVSETIPMITINDFRDGKQLKQLINDHQTELCQTNQLIIDVRNCTGGSDSVYWPLLEYIFHMNPEIQEEPVLHYMTEKNYTNRLNAFQRADFTLDDPNVSRWIKQMREKRHEGFVTLDISLDESFSIKGTKKPYQVVILTDRYCASSGDQFVLDARKSDKVILIGRPTKGVIDYSNQAVEVFEAEGYAFYYATSKSMRVDCGEGIDGKGIYPDHFIPWTPEHLEHDVDLEQAIAYLQQIKINDVKDLKL